MPALETPSARWQELQARRAETRRRLARQRRLARLVALGLLAALLAGLSAALALRLSSGPRAAGPLVPFRGSAALAGPRRQPLRLVPAPCPIPVRFRPLLEQAAGRAHVPLPLLAAVAQTESHWQPQATSAAGAEGLMQLMPATAQALGVDGTDAAANVRGGARYLRSLLDRFHSTRLALAAYNAGPTLVARVGLPAYGETVAYVATVLDQRGRYQGCDG